MCLLSTTMIKYFCVIVVAVIAVYPADLHAQKQRCIPESANGTTTACLPTPVPPPDELTDDGGYTFVYPGPYAVIIIIGVLMLPLSVCLRVCWYRRLRRNRDEAVNHMREIEDEHDHDRRARVEIYLIDGQRGNFTPQLSPPTYDQCISDGPPKYDDLPPSYKQFEDSNKVVITSETRATTLDTFLPPSQSTSRI